MSSNHSVGCTGKIGRIQRLNQLSEELLCRLSQQDASSKFQENLVLFQELIQLLGYKIVD